jgi:hypothetical protein
MANFNGNLLTSIASPQHPGASASLSQFTPGISGYPSVSVQSFTLSGPQTPSLIAEIPILYAGQLAPMTGSELFEKVIVTPREKKLGFVLSTNLFTVDVWSTFRETLRTMVSIDISGSGGTEIDNPFGTPLVFGAMQSRQFQAVVPQDGDAQILNTVVFVFPGVDGTDLVITGTRITVFGPDPDWTEPIRERTEYLTEILAAYNETEQRIQLRSKPRTVLTFRVLTLERKDTATLDALLWGWQSRVFGVPFWPDAQRLLADVNIGDTVIQVDTSYRKFEAGGLMVLWRDMHTHEALSIQNVGPTSLQLAAPTTKAWPADGRTYVIPVLSGRLPDQVQVRRLNNSTAEAEPTFVIEVV